MVCRSGTLLRLVDHGHDVHIAYQVSGNLAVFDTLPDTGEEMEPLERLRRTHRHKTGALLRAALTMGATAAGAPAEVREALERYGDAVGLAFQVADDLLDATATAEELGKEPSDADLEKSTYVRLFGVHEARSRGERLVREAKEALASAGLVSPPLEALADYVMSRRR